MKKLYVILTGILISLLSGCNGTTRQIDLSKIDPGQYDGTWYNRTPLRFIQTNLNERDANMDVDTYIQSLKDASASMIVFNVGGIKAFYPTKLAYHHRNPYLEEGKDLVGEVIKKCHENGIKFIARFDVSKVNESVAAMKPEWLYVGTDGNIVNYNGEVHTCINGGYQQEYVFEILEEAITAYPFDAVFFNMGGYQTSDYSQVFHGICQCDNCKKRFYDSTGFKLPVIADNNDPVYRIYNEFRSTTTRELNERIIKFIKTLDPDIVFQNSEGEILRSESGTGFTSGSYWNYHATENVKRTLNSFRDQTPNDTYNYLIGMDYRHTATSPNIGRIYLAQQMLNGAGPGIYFMGRIETQLDREFIPTLNDIFGFHRKNEKLFTNLQSLARVALVMGSDQDYRGVMKLLTEEHIMYDLLQSRAIGSDRAPRDLEEYDAIILSNVTNMDENFVSQMDDYVKNGGKLLVTGFPGIEDRGDGQAGRIRLQSLGIEPGYELFSQPRSTYLKVSDSDKAELGQKELEDFDVIMMNSKFLKCKTTDNAKGYLRLVPNTMHGPPEKCYFTDSDITDYPGIISNSFGKGGVVFIPWLIGSQYNWKGNNGQRALFLSTLHNLLKIDLLLETDASPLLEISHLANRNGAFEWVGIINHSGQIGDAFREAVPIFDTKIRFRPQKPIKSLYLIRSGMSLKFNQGNGWVECVIPRIDDFDMLVGLYKPD